MHHAGRGDARVRPLPRHGARAVPPRQRRVRAPRHTYRPRPRHPAMSPARIPISEERQMIGSYGRYVTVVATNIQDGMEHNFDVDSGGAVGRAGEELGCGAGPRCTHGALPHRAPSATEYYVVLVLVLIWCAMCGIGTTSSPSCTTMAVTPWLPNMAGTTSSPSCTTGAPTFPRTAG